jgi:hypothetical protein
VSKQARFNFFNKPFRRRTWLRGNLPWALIDLAPKGNDCELSDGRHEWYNADGVSSACYHCDVTAKGQLWIFGDEAAILTNPPFQKPNE